MVSLRGRDAWPWRERRDWQQQQESEVALPWPRVLYDDMDYQP